ncbi:MAG TPA: DUF1638 domain-containing protein [Candidatus Acidoferrum sp.]|nr:DUF1638 domain-containing protein [Candidatus Acidoferrum sp.]
MSRLRLHVVACPVFQRELELLASDAKAQLTFRHLDMGLHEGSAEALRAALQAAIDGTDAGQSDAVAIAYGVCNRGVVGLQARGLPVVIPRAHDCIGMLLGSSRCYLAQLEAQPGTYFQSAGWLEHSPANGEIRRQDITFGPTTSVTREQLAAKYGEENADYLLEQFQNFTQHYQRLAYIATPVPEGARWEAAAREVARQRGWKFERLAGDLEWLRRLLNGDWNKREFLVLKPGERVGLRSDAALIGADPA